MLSAADRDKLFQNGYLSADIYDAALTDPNPAKKLAAMLRRHVAVHMNGYKNAVKLQKENDMARHADAVCFLLGLPTDLCISPSGFRMLAEDSHRDLLQRLYHEGAKIDAAVFEGDPDDLSSFLQNLVFKWQKAQTLGTEEYHLEADFWPRAQTTAMIEQPEKYAPDDTAARTRFFSGDNMFWRTARAGEFGTLIDIYRREEKPFPAEILKAERQENGIGFLTLLLFKKEPELFEKLLDPVLWRGQAEDFKHIWHRHFPKSLQDRFPIENIVQDFQNATARRAMRGEQASYLKRRRRP